MVIEEGYNKKIIKYSYASRVKKYFAPWRVLFRKRKVSRVGKS